MSLIDFVNKGAYGCVFTPPLPCIDSTHKFNKTVVGKIFEHRSEYEQEMQAYKVVRYLDPENEWSLPFKQACKVDTNNKALQSTISRCPFMLADHKHLFHQIVMTNGGMTLGELFEKYQVPEKWMIKYLEQTLTAITRISLGGYSHLDIKPANILVHDNKIFLIDFSLLSRQESIYQDDNSFLFKAKYIWYPPEFYMYSVLNNDNSPNFKRRGEGSLYVYHIPKYGLIRHSEQEFKENAQSATNFMRFFKKNDRYRDTEFLEEIANKIDVYSAGIVFMNIYEKHHYRNPYIFQLLKDMIQPDPRKRLSPTGALHRLKSVASSSYRMPSSKFKKIDKEVSK
jgi:serine/threonine protein kinase